MHAHCTLYSCLQYLPDGSRMKAVSANFSSDIFVMTKTPLIFISFSSPVLIFVLVLVSSTKIRNNFVIFVIVFVVVDEKNTASKSHVVPHGLGILYSLVTMNHLRLMKTSSSQKFSTSVIGKWTITYRCAGRLEAHCTETVAPSGTLPGYWPQTS